MADFDDHYETLQLSVNADPDTIHRVYRLLAQRHHPDNHDTGDPERFHTVREAYRVLSDPDLRAAYDLEYHKRRGTRWRLVGEQESTPDAVEFERRARLGFLGLLYARRRTDPWNPGLTLLEIEDLLGVPREHLEFCSWFLREKRRITITDESRYVITADGAEFFEEQGGEPARKLLQARRP